MSLNAIISSANSGLIAAQTGLRAVSDNIANVGTPGYVRKEISQTSFASGGVESATIKLAANRFLQAASLTAAARSGAATAAADLMDQAQGLFGDPSEDTSFFSSLDKMFAAFTTLVATPASTAARAGALGQVSQFFEQAGIIGAQLDGLVRQADNRISTSVGQANSLLQQIDELNYEVSRATSAGGDPSGPLTQQSQLIDQLSKLVDIKVSDRPQGGMIVRASDGTLLAGDGAATLTYRPGASGELFITPPGGAETSIDGRIATGEIRGLLDLRNTELPAISTQLAELVSKTSDQLNLIHNSFSAAPAPATLTGRNLGLDLPTALTGFTGKTTVALVNSAGVIQNRVDIDFDAGTMSADGGPPAAFTPANFLATLNTALGANGSASFTGGTLSISAAGGNGVAIADDATTPSLQAGRGFSAFFGLNDLIRSTGPSNYDTGLALTDTSGFAGSLKFRISGADGSRIQDITIAAPAGTVGDLVNALNSPTTGVGMYGSFSLDANGQLSFAPTSGSGFTMSVVEDTTVRTPGGSGVSTLFGLGAAARSERLGGFSVRSDILANPSLLAMGKLDLAAAPGTTALAKGDVRGADALSQAGLQRMRFDATVDASGVSSTVSDYAALLSGAVARKSAAALSAKTSAEAAGAEADVRRSSAEGVNLDEELVKLTTYQQAYAASARMIQAAKDMYDVLLQITN